MKSYQYPSVLSIAGSDSGGGAGIQADLKTISSLGCFGTTAITAITVQNTLGVKAIHSVPVSIVVGQIAAVLSDITPAAIKIGMVHTLALVEAIASAISAFPPIPVIFDPVMVATSGDKLIEEDTITGMRTHLFPIASLITPNLDEAAILAGMPIHTVDDMYLAGTKIIASGCNAVLLKGGHLQNKQLTTLYFAADGSVEEFVNEKIETNNTHGSGCTLSSAIASFIARGMDLRTAIASAEAYVHQAILHGADVKTGMGNGPLNHFFNPLKLKTDEMV